MDVKSAFLYGTIEEEVYVTQLPQFKDPNHLDKVYKVVKALYGLHQAPRAWYETLANYLLGNGFKRGKIDHILFIKKQKGEILLVHMSSMGELTFFLGLQVQQKEDGVFISQDKYIAEILKKFNYTDVKSASTPVDLEKPLVKDGDADDIDVHLYKSMIGSLMYLTASRQDIIYLKGKPTLGLWYSRDSPFELVAYTDSDYARATQDRKSTTGGCMLLGNKLIPWQFKKKTMVATSTTKAEYVAVANLLKKGFDAGRSWVTEWKGLRLLLLAKKQSRTMVTSIGPNPWQHLMDQVLRELVQVAFDHYRDAFSVIYLIYAHSSTVMSDESTVTYTEGSGRRVIGPASPDYYLAPSATVTPFQTLSWAGISEYMPQKDEVFLAEEQPLPTAASPTAQSPDYVPESNPKEDPEEDDDEDPKEDPAPSTKETEPFKTDKSAATPPPHPVYRVTARISIPALVPTLVWSDVEIPFPPLPPIPSPSLPLSPPLPVSAPPPASPIRPLGYRAAMIRLRAEAASTSYLLPLPPPIILSHTRLDAPSSGTPPLLLPSTNRREDRPEVTLSPQKRLGIALGPTYEVGESSSAAAARPARGLRADYGFVATMDREIRHDLERDVGYGITDSWDEIVEAMQGTPVVTDVAEFSQRMTEFETRVRQDTNEIYMRDRRAHARTARLMETEARMSREAWGRSIDASDLARVEVMSLRTTVLAQQLEIRELQSANRRRQTALIDQGVTAALAARDANRSTNDDASHNSGTCVRRTKRAARECTYTDFIKCQPLNFKGMEGVAGLSQRFKRMESVFHISNCTVENQVKFSTCTLHSVAL
ncbi:putative reverse transcriptase domain-containing protein, partial [Tanacetum coccineum]